MSVTPSTNSLKANLLLVDNFSAFYNNFTTAIALPYYQTVGGDFGVSVFELNY